MQASRRDGAITRGRDARASSEVLRLSDGCEGSGDNREVGEGIVEGDRWVDKVEMALQLSGDGVRERARELLAGLCVLEDGEVGVEERVCLADRDGEGEPVTSGGDCLGFDVVRRQELIDEGYGVVGGLDELLDLFNRN